MPSSETHLILPVPSVEPIVGAWRARLDPSASAGVPAHITLLGPFVDSVALDDRDIAAIERLFAETKRVRFWLDGIARFSHSLYLAPQPVEPFIALTRAIWSRWPEHPPYGDARREIIPHLTVAVGVDEVTEQAVRTVLEPQLPLSAVAECAWLIARAEDGKWAPLHRFAFSPD